MNGDDPRDFMRLEAPPQQVRIPRKRDKKYRRRPRVFVKAGRKHYARFLVPTEVRRERGDWESRPGITVTNAALLLAGYPKPTAKCPKCLHEFDFVPVSSAIAVCDMPIEPLHLKPGRAVNFVLPPVLVGAIRQYVGPKRTGSPDDMFAPAEAPRERKRRRKKACPADGK